MPVRRILKTRNLPKQSPRAASDMVVIDDVGGGIMRHLALSLAPGKPSHCVLGLYVGFEPPSCIAVAKALKTAKLPAKLDSKGA